MYVYLLIYFNFILFNSVCVRARVVTSIPLELGYGRVGT